MQTLRNFFWNSEEARLRAMWRIAIVIVLLMIFMILFAIIDSLFDDLLPRGTLAKEESILFPLEMTLSFFLSIWITSKYFDKRKLADIGLKINLSWWKDFGFGLLLGAILHSVIFLTQFLAGWIEIKGIYENSLSGFSFIAGIGLWLFTFICAGISEDLFNRGYLLKNISESIRTNNSGNIKPIIWAVVITSLIFGLMHAGNPNANIISTIGLIIAGLMYAVAYVYTGQLALPIGLHITWNFFEGCVFGSPVSGSATDITIIASQQIGPEIMTGGAFGPEAGLVGIASRFLGILLIFLWIKSTRGKLKIVEQISVYSKQ
ncbi:lysostaphin resistance A-like protein [Bacteroidota bacterium]